MIEQRVSLIRSWILVTILGICVVLSFILGVSIGFSTPPAVQPVKVYIDRACTL